MAKTAANIQGIHRGMDKVLGHARRERPPLRKVVGPDLPRRRMFRDLPIHQRLRERWLVVLVVAVPAIHDQVDQEIGVEMLPVRDRKLRGRDAGLDVVAVDVNDRNIESAGEIGRVLGRVSVVWLGGKSQLIVHDHVDCAAGGVPV